MPPRFRKILIVRPSAIGDVAMASAMLLSLKRGYPEAHISWLVEPQVKDVLAENSCVDQVIIWPKAEWRRLLKELRWLDLCRQVFRFRKRLRREGFDLALDAQGLLRSRLLAWLSGARSRIGFDSKEPGRFLLTRVISRGGESQQMSSEYRHMISELGLDPGPFHQCLEVSETDIRDARDVLKIAGAGRDYVAIAAFTTRTQKHWFDERWIDLARSLHEEWGWPVVILGGPSDRERAEAMCLASGGTMVNLAGKVRLSISMAVVQGCRLLIGVDTGLTHMGPAFDRPTVALFGATCPYLETSRTDTRVVYHARDCSPCKRNPTCEGKFFCMAEISVDEVLTTSRELLGKRGESS